MENSVVSFPVVLIRVISTPVESLSQIMMGFRADSMPKEEPLSSEISTTICSTFLSTEYILDIVLQILKQ